MTRPSSIVLPISAAAKADDRAKQRIFGQHFFSKNANKSHQSFFHFSAKNNTEIAHHRRLWNRSEAKAGVINLPRAHSWRSEPLVSGGGQLFLSFPLMLSAPAPSSLDAIWPQKPFAKFAPKMPKMFFAVLHSFTLLLFPLLFLLLPNVHSLDNGLARKPPMGWMSWAKFYCETDCQRHPFSCINEQLYMDMAERMVDDGYLDAGYELVHIDDCWMQWQRDAQGRLMANQSRFPSGIAALADFMHARKLKLGIYEDIGTTTCAGYPGSWSHVQADAQQFADWKVDYLKLDGCNLNSSLFSQGYVDMGTELNKTGRAIVYSCSWPAYLYFDHEEQINYTAIGEHCNLWRNFDDIARSWGSVMSIIRFYAKNQEIFQKAQGPGRWNDPDMIIVGNTELSVEQAKVQMSIWAIWSAPLIMSNDLRTIMPAYRDILLNKRVIAVDQDPLGVFGQMVFKVGSRSQKVTLLGQFRVFTKQGTQTYVFTKEMTPASIERNVYSYAVAVLNFGFLPIQFATDLKSIGLNNPSGYSLQDLWSGKQLGHFSPNDVYNVTLGPTSVSMFKATVADFVDDFY